MCDDKRFLSIIASSFELRSYTGSGMLPRSSRVFLKSLQLGNDEHFLIVTRPGEASAFTTEVTEGTERTQNIPLDFSPCREW